jgi:hypothetical protein
LSTPAIRKTAAKATRASATTDAATAAAATRIAAIAATHDATVAATRATEVAATVAATHAAATIAATRYAADAARSRIWAEIRADLTDFQKVKDVMPVALWRLGDDPFAEMWKLLQETGSVDPDGPWQFWLDWYAKAREGRHLPVDLWEAIALIDTAIWEAGPEAVAEEIARLQGGFGSTPPDLASELKRFPPGKPEVVQTVRENMAANAKELPPTFDAIESLILLETERLQTKNYQSDEDRDECRRQIAVLVSLYEAIRALRARLPGPEEHVSQSDAEQSEKLLRLYGRKLAELPRTRVDEVIGSVWKSGGAAFQFGLVTGSAYLASLYGVPMQVSVPVAAVCFAPDKAGEIIKAARSTLGKPST